MYNTVLNDNSMDMKQIPLNVSDKIIKRLETAICRSFFNIAEDIEGISYLRKQYIDQILSEINFKPVIEKDIEMDIVTVAVYEIDMYGEGDTLELAIKDLLYNIFEYIQVWINNTDFFSKVERIEKQICMLKLIRCHGDEKFMKSVLRLDSYEI